MRVQLGNVPLHRHKVTAVLVTCLIVPLGVRGTTSGQSAPEWPDYLGGADSSSYSALAQINRSNVHRLEIAWTYQAGANDRLRFNPIVVDGTMYALGKERSIVALDATSGKELWVYEHDPLFQRDITDRGINVWQRQDGSERRLLFAAGAYLQAIDARTGKLITSFGKNGKVDLREGLGRDPSSIIEFGFGSLGWTSPGRVFENLLIVGSRTGEAYNSPPGDIRAYDVVSGTLVWSFHTVPRPGELGYDTYPKEAHEYVGANNAWGDISLDEARGIVYVPTGSPTYDFYGGDRKGSNLFGNCLLALDARTGKRLWHYQVIHHDLWDYDNTAAPQLVTVTHEGQEVDVVAMAGKTGFLYVFDRVTGEPLWPIEERKVPASDVPGEEAWPTQPFPTAPPPFARQSFTVRDISPHLDAAEHAKWTDMVGSSVNKGLFTPPALQNTMQIPGNAGGANWGSTAADPTQGVVYVLSKDEPTMLKLERRPPRRQTLPEGPPEQIGRIVYEETCQACHGEGLRGVPPEIPSLVGVTTRLDSHTIKRTLLVGMGRMPPFKLGDRELTGLIAYLADPSTAEEAAAAFDAEHRADPEGRQADEATGPLRFWSDYGYMRPTIGPAPIAPPWSTMTAYDLNKGTIKWQVPIGEVPELVEKGIEHTGSGSPRGAVVTAGGLIFSGTPDGTFRAFDKDTGEELWTKKLPLNPLGVAATYEAGGRQYVVISASPLREESDESATPKEAEAIEPAGAAPAKAAETAEDEAQAAYFAFALPNQSNTTRQ
ncbi:MAG: PQQ-binding-like beta-propeller repeat protein [Luteitalea sp.]|nr:PQQ-binding-like beta-propeller repeat protein [Luteitalea sp.]